MVATYRAIKDIDDRTVAKLGTLTAETRNKMIVSRQLMLEMGAMMASVLSACDFYESINRKSAAAAAAAAVVAGVKAPIAAAVPDHLAAEVVPAPDKDVLDELVESSDLEEALSGNISDDVDVAADNVANATDAAAAAAALPNFDVFSFTLPIPRQDFVDMLTGSSSGYTLRDDGSSVIENPVTRLRIYIGADGARGYSTHEDSSDVVENAFSGGKSCSKDADELVRVLGTSSMGQLNKIARGGNCLPKDCVTRDKLRRMRDAVRGQMTILGVAKFDDRGDLWEYRTAHGAGSQACFERALSSLF